MSHLLPPAAHPARELFDVAHLAAIATGEQPLITLPGALFSARRAFEANPAIKRLAYIVLRAENDQIDLITVGRRGGWRKEWRFGPVTRAARLA